MWSNFFSLRITVVEIETISSWRQPKAIIKDEFTALAMLYFNILKSIVHLLLRWHVAWDKDSLFHCKFSSFHFIAGLLLLSMFHWAARTETYVPLFNFAKWIISSYDHTVAQALDFCLRFWSDWWLLKPNLISKAHMLIHYLPCRFRQWRRWWNNFIDAPLFRFWRHGGGKWNMATLNSI